MTDDLHAPIRKVTRTVELVPPFTVWLDSLDASGIYSSEYVVESLRAMGYAVTEDADEKVLALFVDGVVCVDGGQGGCISLILADAVQRDDYYPVQMLGKFGSSGRSLKVFFAAWGDRYD